MKSLNKKRGSAVAETVLLVSISLVIVIGLFYPQITTLTSNTLNHLNNWYSNAISIIGVP